LLARGSYGKTSGISARLPAQSRVPLKNRSRADEAIELHLVFRNWHLSDISECPLFGRYRV